jgi:hypothetical protein
MVFACPNDLFRQAKNLTTDRQPLYFLCGYFLPQSTLRNYARLND